MTNRHIRKLSLAILGLLSTLSFGTFGSQSIVAEQADTQSPFVSSQAQHVERQQLKNQQMGKQAYLFNRRLLALNERISNGDKRAIFELAELYAQSPVKAHRETAPDLYRQAERAGVTKQSLQAYPHSSASDK